MILIDWQTPSSGQKREDKLCKGDYKYTPFAKSVLALLTGNRRKIFPSRRSSVFCNFQ